MIKKLLKEKPWFLWAMGIPLLCLLIIDPLFFSVGIMVLSFMAGLLGIVDYYIEYDGEDDGSRKLL